MPCFPLPFVPTAIYRKSGHHARYFGAPRAKGRSHAGCDLLAPEGTPIFAIDDGIVMEWDPNKEFYRGTKSIVVQHRGSLVRYCEIKNAPEGIRRHGVVKAGTVIAYVGKMFHDSMLHFELYAKPYGAGQLTNRANKPFNRRADLTDPTQLLDRLANFVTPMQELGDV